MIRLFKSKKSGKRTRDKGVDLGALEERANTHLPPHPKILTKHITFSPFYRSESPSLSIFFPVLTLIGIRVECIYSTYLTFII